VADAQEESGAYEAFKEAIEILRREYLYGEKVDGSKQFRELTYSAIRGMLYALNDPFTSFLDPEAWAQMQQATRGDFEGIGAVLEPFGQDVRVLRPIPGTPAFKAGLKPRDIIMSVAQVASNGKIGKAISTLGMDINEVVKLIKGPSGTKVAISVLRKGVSKPITFVITRAHIEPPIVQSWMEDKEHKIGRILLNEFNEKSGRQFDKALSELEKQGLRALIFDLRYNPGGLLNVAVEIGSRFVDRGPIVIIQSKTGQREELYARPSLRMKKRYPLVVLINESSASASEIVAGAIQDNGVGILVGQHTFGKGLVQTLLQLSDNSALRLTTQKYFTSKGKDISNKYDEEHRPIFGTGGIKPDVEVKQSEEWIDQNFEDKVHDTQLQKALEILRTRLASAKTTSHSIR
jgi:carboxyl-terminal processing protease